MKKLDKIQQANVNASVEYAGRALIKCAKACAENKSPIRSITFKVLRNGDTRMHVAYRK